MTVKLESPGIVITPTATTSIKAAELIGDYLNYISQMLYAITSNNKEGDLYEY